MSGPEQSRIQTLRASESPPPLYREREEGEVVGNSGSARRPRRRGYIPSFYSQSTQPCDGSRASLSMFALHFPALSSK